MKTRLSNFYASIRKHHLQYLIISLVFLIIFVFLAVFIKNQKQIPMLDRVIRDFAYNFRGEKFGVWYYIFRMITEFGFVFIIIPLFVLFLVFTRVDLRSFMLGFGTLFTYLCNTLVKAIIDRPRPILENQWMTETSSSFPSGHSMTSMFFYGIMIFFIFKSARPTKNQKIALITTNVIIVLLIGFSRIVLGVHYFTDVVGGFILALALVNLAIYIYYILDKKGFTFLRKYFFKDSINTTI